MSIVPEAVVEQGITDLRESGDLDEERWELFSDTERKGHSFARGHREGLEEGREAGRAEGLEEGLEAGRAEGLKVGRTEGLEAGRAEGLEEGRAEGLEAGRAEGLEAGRAEGLEAGQCKTLRRAVLDILELRGFAITNTARERVSACESVELLERWYAAAKSPSNLTIEQVLARGSK